jgi:hypothetical protein
MPRSRELAELATSYDSGGSLGFRNRIINGAMSVHQRGGTISASGTVNTYGLDRFAIRTTSGSAVVSMQQSTIAPAGFYNSLLCTVTTADASLAAGDLTVLHQKIEGVNVADLGWGTANAQTVTISFQVRSNVTGTYGVGVANNDSNRSYPSTFTINAADTWETKTLTIPGDTTGTWNIGTTSTALYVFFSLSAGSDFTGGTTNAWNAADRRGASGQVNWAATLSNTFYITGVQLEAGSVATPFERRDYGRELIMCQRYAWSLRGDAQFICNAFMRSTTTGVGVVQFPVTMRATAAMTVPNATDYFNMSHGNQDNKAPTLSISGGGVQINQNNASVGLTFASGSSTIGWGGLFSTSNANSYVLFTAEL